MVRKIFSLIFILIVFLVLFCWATFPTGGGIEDIKNGNPKYQHPNVHFQNLVEIYNKTPEPNVWSWDAAYLSMCDYYGHDYAKIDGCVNAYRACEGKKPLSKDGNSKYQRTDILSKENEAEYQECLTLFKPKG